MTETSPIGTINTLLSKHAVLPAEQQRQQSDGQGRPIFGIDLRVVDIDGKPLPCDGKSQDICRFAATGWSITILVAMRVR